jgi:hypothetical protein
MVDCAWFAGCGLRHPTTATSLISLTISPQSEPVNHGLCADADVDVRRAHHVSVIRLPTESANILERPGVRLAICPIVKTCLCTGRPATRTSTARYALRFIAVRLTVLMLYIWPILHFNALGSRVLSSPLGILEDAVFFAARVPFSWLRPEHQIVQCLCHVMPRRG